MNRSRWFDARSTSASGWYPLYQWRDVPVVDSDLDVFPFQERIHAETLMVLLHFESLYLDQDGAVL